MHNHNSVAIDPETPFPPVKWYGRPPAERTTGQGERRVLEIPRRRQNPGSSAVGP